MEVAFLLIAALLAVPGSGAKHAGANEEFPLHAAVADPRPHDVALLGHAAHHHSLANVWGYAAEGREYAFVGHWHGTTIYDVTDPAQPLEVAEIPGPDSIWREMKTYGGYLYIIADNVVQGMQIVDLQHLPASAPLVTTYMGFAMGHTLYIEESRGLAFIAGSPSPYAAGILILSLANPIAPQVVGHWNDVYCHDLHVRGDLAYAFNGAAGIAVIDVSNPATPVTLNTYAYPDLAYCHSGWLSPDGAHLAVTDEIDEENGVPWTRVHFFDVLPGGALSHRSMYEGPNRATDHNVMWVGDVCHLSNYTYGYTVIDVSDIDAPYLTAKYDTYHFDDAPGFAGPWGVYALLPSGNVLISDINSGLYIFRYDESLSGLEDFDYDGAPDVYETDTGVYGGPEDMGTDPRNPDTDGDGISDGQERDLNTNPLDPWDGPPLPAAGAVMLVALILLLLALTLFRRDAPSKRMRKPQ